MSKYILIVFLDIVPFPEHTILFWQKEKELINQKCSHFALLLSTILVVTHGDKLKFLLTEEHVVFEMDVKIKKKSKTKEIQLLKSQDFHLKKHTRLIRLIDQELQRLTCLKTTRDGRMKRESTQGSTRISEISSPSIFLAQRRSTKLMLNFVTSFTLIDDENRNLPGRRDANAIKKQISIFPRLFWVFKKG